MKYTIGVFDVNKGFGGHEEGGWYYTYGILKHRSPKIFSDRAKAREYAQRFQAKLDRQANNRGSYTDINSVLCEGVLMAEVHEGELPSSYPEETPYYC